MRKVLEQIKNGLIVSCQALEDEPLHSSYIMGRMAAAAQMGGAAGIRANSIEDIGEIKRNVTLPIIGIVKKTYEDSEIYITPTRTEVDALVREGVDIIAMDATRRLRPGGADLETFFHQIRTAYPGQLFMADCSTVEEGLAAARAGFDIIGTTLAGYTPYTADTELPDLDMIQALRTGTGRPVIAEGGIWDKDDLREVFRRGAHAAVIGTAITRPQEITKYYVESLEKEE